MFYDEYKYRRPGWLKSPADRDALTEIIVESMFQDPLPVLMLKIANFCEDRSLRMDDIQKSLFSSITHSVLKGLDDGVISQAEEKYFAEFLHLNGIEFSAIPCGLRKIFKEGVNSRPNVTGASGN